MITPLAHCLPSFLTGPYKCLFTDCILHEDISSCILRMAHIHPYDAWYVKWVDRKYLLREGRKRKEDRVAGWDEWLKI